ncbi:hypothetical protein K9L16_00960 [Candidatus Pacearchaeota archaeon]|nr:hypothetical protein [Candidatus Pacearchaeota archaeon]
MPWPEKFDKTSVESIVYNLEHKEASYPDCLLIKEAYCTEKNKVREGDLPRLLIRD